MLAPIVQALGPVLRVDDLPLELLRALEAWAEALVITVVAACAEQPAAFDGAGFCRVAVLDAYCPQPFVALPIRRDHFLPVLDEGVQLVFSDGFSQVFENVGGIRQRFRLGPRLEVEAEGVQVRVGAYAGIAEQVPGAAHSLPGLENRKHLVRLVTSKVSRSADARHTGSYDQNIERLNWKSSVRGHVASYCCVIET
ncbi:hypothetical protein PAERUG_E10_London_26_VIM_2_06_13_01056 [Pseudomonas aeruginosa]|nr:hypothetical protein PAERUG_E10_London_26_VIM_2_06_13_01056 [Pseudomonas aeruginosa]CRO45320.1 hypothetical protein PAERUG_E7_London_9_VIM_2_02_13_01078 [Pseudomonas aeruginosa]CRO46348.1 hypothetical protein PAERUG_P17_North_West_14_VIM_2_03_10_04592 [Pseudomonas aeruginosa]CRP68829.1 hypothetical protein PAERUG_E15_London_28_01_14_00820 [Pseudomonas aeruginosa]CRQ34231.1 hypothetical protein PAERUG_P47_London_12_VIM_2_12_12_00416 [Pseudomonas aeruginosa]